MVTIIILDIIYTFIVILTCIERTVEGYVNCCIAPNRFIKDLNFKCNFSLNVPVSIA